MRSDQDDDGFGLPELTQALNPQTDVSRETCDRLTAFVALLRKWNATHNLIGPAEAGRLWRRHVLDSAQIETHVPPRAKTWVDFGSGGGFPVAVIACLRPDRRYIAIESAGKKAAFLRHVARELGLMFHVKHARIEAVDPEMCDIVSARALAPLPKLLEWGAPWLSSCGQALFLKGSGVDMELTNAQ